jgi:hypothetical protein
MFADTTSIYHDSYDIYGAGYGKSPLESYKNAVVVVSNLYEENLKQYILIKNYPNLQIESPLKITIIYLEEEINTPVPVPPINTLNFNNSIKNTVVVRNINNSTSQYTDTATSIYSCIFETYYYALDSCNIDENKNISSLYISSCITSVKN